MAASMWAPDDYPDDFFDPDDPDPTPDPSTDPGDGTQSTQFTQVYSGSTQFYSGVETVLTK